jgi:hypothetical protein
VSTFKPSQGAFAAAPLPAAGRGAVFLIVLALCASLCTGTALARWRTISQTPSASSPYYVCPPGSSGARCAVIEDPARGSDRRGPVAAGAVTAGPEQEVSPAFSGSGVEGGYSPSDLRAAYGLPSATPGAGAGQTVAVVDAYDDPHAESDLAAYRSEYKIPACTKAGECFRKVDQTGGSSYPVPNSKWDTEISIDLDMVSAICPECHILLVEANSSEGADLAAAEQEAVALGATEISDSYTESPAEASKYASSYEHPGIPVAAAAGDNDYGVAAPASFPGVIAVGGTTLTHLEHGWSEAAWGDASGGERSGTGSGCSTEPKPAWQRDSGCAFRTMNDVATVADPNTPVSVYDSEETGNPWLLLGGTSVSAPIVAAAMALSNPYTRSFEGAQPLYLESAAGAGFNDVVSGVNGNCGTYLCTAGLGYDGPTGLGGLRGAPQLPTPAPRTEEAASITSGGATLQGTVEPHGGTITQCGFEYGPTTSYGSQAPCGSIPSPTTGTVPVAATITGLISSSLYHVRLAVSFSGGRGASTDGYLGGSAAGTDLTFTTAGEPPSVAAGAPSSATASSLSLTGTVNPHGVPVASCDFEYGPTSAYGSSERCSSSPGNGRNPVPVTAVLHDLTPDTTYHYRLSAAGENTGTSYTGDETASTLTEPPSVVTEPPTSITATSATLNADVELNGAQATSCDFEFGSDETRLPCVPAPQPGGPAAVAAAASGLTPATTYLYRIIVGTAGGVRYGSLEEFTTAPAPATAPVTPAPINVLVSLPPDIEPSVEAPDAELLGRAFIIGSTAEVRLPIRCLSAAAVCHGVFSLSTLDAVSISTNGRGKRVLPLASGRFTIPGGGSGTLTLKLSGPARGLVGRLRQIRARATVLLAISAGHSQSTQSVVTLRRR